MTLETLVYPLQNLVHHLQNLEHPSQNLVHDEGCTKFCEGCTKHSRVNFEVGIGLQSLHYGFQNEIMDHLCSDGGPENNRIGCTKFNEGCTKF